VIGRTFLECGSVEDDLSLSLCGACGVKEIALIIPVGLERNLFIFSSLLCTLGQLLG
jgi:hypothetical protein